MLGKGSPLLVDEVLEIGVHGETLNSLFFREEGCCSPGSLIPEDGGIRSPLVFQNVENVCKDLGELVRQQ